ncbi:dormancy-associated protein 1-like [Selaginella moellendorffii]|uniref:dormancy-associated protein 1-like n=1 Tax=Selaginella moellendorffii TaxID=88036 RepID=UPI000D1CF086|nr:dormancy-associated protein 1-like [Selaginella moellendorffii]|eukprot:XP_024544646.1 dormancy-associated protein 1-like [Selaginella moellendorffii]
MGLLDKLWDDVVAGPQPETGLGKLRERELVNAARAKEKMIHAPGFRPPFLVTTPVTRDNSLATSPGSSTLSELGWKLSWSPSNRKMVDEVAAAAAATASSPEPISPSACEWMVASILDR